MQAVTVNTAAESEPPDGIERFLKRFCSQAEVLAAVFAGSARRLVSVHDGNVLCDEGDSANEFWIIQSGRFRIESGSRVTERGPGDLIGEQAFFRTSPDGQPDNKRGATVKAAMDSHVFRIDKSLLAGMTDAQKALWNETCARSLSSKLDEATAQRRQLRQERINTEFILRRFVAEEGQEAAFAAFIDGDFQRHITTEECDAVIWFSDVKGFSRYAKGKPTHVVGRVIRELMDIQAAAIRDAGGQIDKFMGDGLMAFWKAPDRARLEAAADKAVAAALVCAANLRDHFEAENLPCDIRIGIHAGTVIFGDFGGSDRVAFTVIGDTVNAASRYEQAAKCAEERELGRVRISEDVFQMLGDAKTISSIDPAPRSLSDKHGMCFPARTSKI